jgi:hypothetical protein
MIRCQNLTLNLFNNKFTFEGFPLHQARHARACIRYATPRIKIAKERRKEKKMSLYTVFSLLGTQTRALDPKEGLILRVCCRDVRRAVNEGWNEFWQTWAPLLFRDRSALSAHWYCPESLLLWLRGSWTVDTEAPATATAAAAESEKVHLTSKALRNCVSDSPLQIAWYLPNYRQLKRNLPCFSVASDLYECMRACRVSGEFVLGFYLRLLATRKPRAVTAAERLEEGRARCSVEASCRTLAHAQRIFAQTKLKNGELERSSAPKLSLKRKFQPLPTLLPTIK